MTRLLSIQDVTTRPTGNKNPLLSPGDEFLYVDVAAVDNQAKRIHEVKKLLGADAPSRARKLLKSGDVIVSTVRPNLNAVAIVPSELDGAIGSTGFCVLRANMRLLIPEYLFYFVRSQNFIKPLLKLVSGALYPAVSDNQVLEQLLPIPSLDEQQRIVDILSRAEGIVRLRREAQQKAAEIIPALFLDMFGDPASNPKGWPTALLGNISRIIGGSTLPNGEPFVGQVAGYQLLKVGDMNLPTNKVYFSTSKEWASDQQKTYSSVPVNSIVFPKRGAAIATNKKRITTRPALLDPNLMAVAPDEAVISHAFLYEWFCQFDLVKISSGTTIPQLNKGDLSPLVMITPPLELQSKFHELRASFIAVQEAQRQALDIAQATFDALLAQSFAPPTAQQAAA